MRPVIARASLAAVLALLAATSASGRSTYAAFESRDIVVQGKGDGMKEVSRGIDWWVSGEPPRKYQRIGTIVDLREDTGGANKITNSRDVAKLVIDAGGNAAIILSQESKALGGNPVFSTFGGQQYGQSVTQGPERAQIESTLAVIRYVGPAT